MVPITTITVAILSVIFLKLSFGIIKIRKQNKILLGDGENEPLIRAISAQRNFCEHIPITLFLIICLELNGFYWFATAFLVAVFLIGRIFHIIGILSDEVKNNSIAKRVWGMTLTFLAMIFLIISNIGWLGYVFLVSS